MKVDRNNNPHMGSTYINGYLTKLFCIKIRRFNEPQKLSCINIWATLGMHSASSDCITHSTLGYVLPPVAWGGSEFSQRLPLCVP